ncbi:hypothetical protein BC937DRAFT_95361 [Endogone sp. FLAS-F59071]|nr:hypothetical protein BC937DRAFT_95361 [Endogone sp. FLAS-F59071]|eukprot:RUS13420.1 hypothetical protein BC937DRAFT_95361 [Endogone sp. FLAS-F59071]
MSNLGNAVPGNRKPSNPSNHGSPMSSDDSPRRAKSDHDDIDDESDDDETPKPEKRAGRRKIKIEYIDDKSRRHITFSKRKAGIMKKAYELSTLTGTQVLLLVVSETGLVYTFTTPKLQPLVTKPEGKNLIQACLNAPDVPSGQETSSPSRAAQPQNVYNDTASQVDNSNDNMYNEDRKPQHQAGGQIQQSAGNYAIAANMGYPQSYSAMPAQMPLGNAGLTSPNYLNTAQYQYATAQQHMYGATAQQAGQYNMPPTSYWSGNNGNGNGKTQYPSQSPEKK